MPIPVALAREAGMRPGYVSVVGSIYGDVALAWSPPGPAIDSIAAAAAALEALTGDYVFAEFGEDGLVALRVTRATDLASVDGVRRLALEIGLGAGTDPPTVASIGRALGLTGNPPPTWSAIRRHLTARDEAELAELIGVSEGAEAEDDLWETLMSTFGRERGPRARS